MGLCPRALKIRGHPRMFPLSLLCVVCDCSGQPINGAGVGGHEKEKEWGEIAITWLESSAGFIELIPPAPHS